MTLDFRLTIFDCRLEKKLNKQSFCRVLLILLLALSFPAHAQPKLPKIGWLGSRSAESLGSGRELFRRDLAELGYVEGKNIVFDYRSAE